MPKFEVDTQIYIFFQGYCLCLIEVERVSLIIDFVSLSGVRFDFLFVDDYFVGLSAGGAEAVVVLGRAFDFQIRHTSRFPPSHSPSFWSKTEIKQSYIRPVR